MRSGRACMSCSGRCGCRWRRRAAALGTTGARATARTVRARSLTVLLETADMLFAETIRWTELRETAMDAGSQRSWETRYADSVARRGRWLKGCNSGRRMEVHRLRRRGRTRWRCSLGWRGSVDGDVADGSLMAHLAAQEKDALQNIEIAFESVRAVWSGVEVRGRRRGGRRCNRVNAGEPRQTTAWLSVDGGCRSNWTLRVADDAACACGWRWWQAWMWC